MVNSIGPLFALSTDFGADSGYVAQMKAVIISAVPNARFIDVTHGINAQSVRHAETILRGCYFGFPLGTVHVVVVDPGVGTARRPIAVSSRGFYYVGPDNGVLGIPIAQPSSRVVELNKPAFFRHPIAPTFHGRDIFAPIAAELGAGLQLDDVGTPISDPIPSTLPACNAGSDRIRGETLAACRFGNLLTNIPTASLGRCRQENATSMKCPWRLSIAGQEALWVNTYGEGSFDTLLALVGSDGYVEIAVRNGSAADKLGQTTGLEVVCERYA